MPNPEYVTKEEVKRTCGELGISDWTELSEPVIRIEEAEIVLNRVNVGGMEIGLDDFRQGLEVELEHGLRFEDANVTNNHPLLTGKIVLAHMKESLDYYRLLDVAELEGDLFQAVQSENIEKARDKYRKLTQARAALSHAILNRMK